MTDDAAYAADAELVADFARALPMRIDRAHCCSILARELAEHHADLWPNGEPAATPAWIAGNVPDILEDLAPLFAEAGDNDHEPRAIGFLTRMAWLPALPRNIDCREQLEA